MLPYVGYLACGQYSCNNRDCSTEEDRIPRIVAENNEWINVDRELALAVAQDLI